MMVALRERREASPKGHIAIYAVNDRRRNAICRAARAAGHSCEDAGTVDDLRRALEQHRFDVGVWVVRDEAEAETLGRALDGLKLPIHTLVIGAPAALPHIRRRRGGSLRFVPAHLTAAEIARVATTSITRGTWIEEGEDTNHQREAVELESIIDSAASSVYADARRKSQRFSSSVSAETGQVFGSRSALRKIFSSLLGVVVELAPAGASINTQAVEGDDEWQISVAATVNGASRRPISTKAGDLSDEEDALQAVSQEIRDQGGILWVDLAGPEALSVSFTLPLPAEAMANA